LWRPVLSCFFGTGPSEVFRGSYCYDELSFQFLSSLFKVFSPLGAAGLLVVLFARRSCGSYRDLPLHAITPSSVFILLFVVRFMFLTVLFQVNLFLLRFIYINLVANRAEI